MIFAVFDPWLLTQEINCSFYHLSNVNVAEKDALFSLSKQGVTEISEVEW